MTTPLEAPPIGSPPPTSDGFLETPDGELLHVEHFIPQNRSPRLVAVFAHGFSAYAAPYRHVAQTLVEAGIAATLYDARGHGHSTGRRGHVERFSDYTADLARVVAQARAPYPDLAYALIGHSQGGAVVLDYLLSEPAHRPLCVVAAAPMLEIIVPVPWVERALNRVFGPLIPRCAFPNHIQAEMITRNLDVRKIFWRDPLVHHVATSRWLSEVQRAEARIKAGATKMNVPIFLATAGDDRIVSPRAEDDFRDAVPRGLVTQKTYQPLFHELFLEPERQQVLDDMMAWLEARMSTASAPAP